MKLMRVGPLGQEKPAILDKDGKVRDLSGHVADIGGAAISPEGLAKIAAIDPASLPEIAVDRIGACVAGTGKFICIGLTKSVAADYVTQGIRCNAICPGTVESPSLQDRMRAQGDYDAARAAFIARQPMGRLGTPEEIADLAVYIAGATYTSGQAFAIDGGWTI